MERWADIKGFEGYYQVSNKGRIKSLKRKIKIKNRWGDCEIELREKVLSLIDDGNGYLSINLQKDRKIKTFKVHRLVALAFCENPQGYKQVNHKDENKKNNNAENLEWCTMEYNLKYGTRLKRIKEKNQRKVAQIGADGIIKVYNSIKEAGEKTGINNKNICSVCKRQRNKAGGYRWEYYEELEDE